MIRRAGALIWNAIDTVPKDGTLVLIMLDEAAGTYPVLARWIDHPNGFCWHVPGSSDQGGWHEKCALKWAPVEVPKY